MASDLEEIASWCRNHHDDILRDIREAVSLDSPSTVKAATDRLGELLAGWLKRAGAAEVRRIPQEAVGDHWVATWTFPTDRPPASGRTHFPDSKPALLLAHFDTVWELGEAARRPFRIEGDRAYGPGIFDMKAGLVQGIWSLQCLTALGLSVPRTVRMLLTSDEETGSRTSRAFIEELARESAYVCVLEPGLGVRGDVKTWRKGVGVFRLRITGRPAHAGADHAEGVSAIEELAHQVLRLHGMTDDAKGTTVNVGVVRGGTRSNVVAAEAEARVDFRVRTLREGRKMEEACRRLTPVLKGCRLEVTGGLSRPPMERTAANAAMAAAAIQIAAELGFPLQESGTGGASDGNFTAALGVPTLDGLGAVGHGSHSYDEHVLIPTIAQRTALLARLLQVL